MRSCLSSADIEGCVAIFVAFQLGDSSDLNVLLRQKPRRPPRDQSETPQEIENRLVLPLPNMGREGGNCMLACFYRYLGPRDLSKIATARNQFVDVRR